MYKKTIKYTDYNGKERIEDFYFNFSKSELMELEFSTEKGLSETVKDLVETNNVYELMKIFKELILKAYGKKSEDGRRFIKSEELRNEFAQTEAYSQLFIELANDEKEAEAFVNGII